MDGYVARLREICDLADRYDAMVMVDDSHAVGFVGPTGRGTPELHDVVSRVDIVTGTLGKALGGASGGYTSARAEIVELLRQRSRPYLFSNTIAPPVVAASLAVIGLLERSGDLRETLRRNTAEFRTRMAAEGFDVLPGDHPIVPVMFGDARLAAGVLPGAARGGGVRRRVLVPGRPGGQGAHPDPAVRRPHPRRHRPRRPRLHHRARSPRLLTEGHP